MRETCLRSPPNQPIAVCPVGHKCFPGIFYVQHSRRVRSSRVWLLLHAPALPCLRQKAKRGKPANFTQKYVKITVGVNVRLSTAQFTTCVLTGSPRDLLDAKQESYLGVADDAFVNPSSAR